MRIITSNLLLQKTEAMVLFFWLHCCVRAFSSCGEWGLLFIAVHGFLIAVASLVAEHGLLARGLSSCGTWAQ